MSIKTNQMITPKWTILSLLLAAIVVASLVLFTGCTQKPIGSIDPELDDSIFFNLTYDDSGSVESFIVSKSDSGDSSYSEVYEAYYDTGVVIAVSGGSVIISGGSYEFEVPSASISENTVISVSFVSFAYNGNNITLCEFSPDGLQFDPSATLRFYAGGLNSPSKSFNLYWLNPVTKRWETQESKSPDVNGLVSFSISHFSKYGVSE